MRISKGFVLMASAVLLSACHHQPPAASVTQPASTPATVPSAPPPPAPAPRPAAAAPHTPTAEEIFARESLSELNAQHPLGDAFFDYDQSTLRDDARTALQHDAEWLRRWPSVRVAVQGQCDERGSAEYNLALGDKRAHAVETYLSSLGVPTNRIQLVSLGKESPVCSGNSEECWSQNRRGHFVITAK